jgi:hypothetical protein
MARNIFEVINENINTMNENVLDLIKKVATVEQEVIALSVMFNAPEQPNARGEDGVNVVSSEQVK